jgi:hypothetical protein
MVIERGSIMEDPKEITVSITDRFFTLDLPIDDEQLIGNVLLGLAQYVKEGSSIKKRADTHRMAEANKAFAHYKW